MKTIAFLPALLLAAPLAFAKLPPLTPDAQAKADEAKAKSAWTDTVAAYQLCKAQDRAAESYFKTAKAANRDTKPAAQTAPCADPGPYAAAAAPTAAAQKPIEQSGAHSPAGMATTPPSASPATQAQTQGTKK
jgi:hypothetical protein